MPLTGTVSRWPAITTRSSRPELGAGDDGVAVPADGQVVERRSAASTASAIACSFRLTDSMLTSCSVRVTASAVRSSNASDFVHDGASNQPVGYCGLVPNRKCFHRKAAVCDQSTVPAFRSLERVLDFILCATASSCSPVRPRDHPAALAVAAEERGFDTIYVPEHTHIPVRRDAAHPGTGDESLPDDRYMRTLDPWVSLATAAAVTSRIRLSTAVALPVESDPITLAKAIATLDHLSGGRVTIGAGFGWNTDELTDHHVPAGQAAYRPARVRRGDARAVDPGRGVVRRGVRLVRPLLGLAEAGAAARAADHRRRRRPEDVPVDRRERRRLDDHADRAGHLRQGRSRCARRGPTPAGRRARHPRPDRGTPLPRGPRLLGGRRRHRADLGLPDKPEPEILAYLDKLAGRVIR